MNLLLLNLCQVNFNMCVYIDENTGKSMDMYVLGYEHVTNMG